MQTDKKTYFYSLVLFPLCHYFHREAPTLPSVQNLIFLFPKTEGTPLQVWNTAFFINPALNWQEYEVLLGYSEEMKEWLLEKQHDQCTSWGCSPEGFCFVAALNQKRRIWASLEGNVRHGHPGVDFAWVRREWFASFENYLCFFKVHVAKLTTFEASLRRTLTMYAHCH